jgi:hypothetical protein
LKTEITHLPTVLFNPDERRRRRQPIRSTTSWWSCETMPRSSLSCEGKMAADDKTRIECELEEEYRTAPRQALLKRLWKLSRASAHPTPDGDERQPNGANYRAADNNPVPPP